MTTCLKTWIFQICLCGTLLGADNAEKNAWTLGIYTGPSLFALEPAADIKNPVLTGADVTDMPVDTLAHPFMVRKDSVYYLFFTAKDAKTGKGGIGLAESKDGLHWKYRRAVLREPFVVSHPCVFEWRNEFYLVPETYTENSVRLYKATQFPEQWKYEADLLRGESLVSPTLVRYQEMWWMFAGRQGNETLRLFYASDLGGPWKEHPQSPIVQKDPNIARPGGRPLIIEGVLYRLAQDCYPTYGNQVRALRVTSISSMAYSEEMSEPALVKASSQGWNAKAMHHVDAHRAEGRWIAAVDALGH